MHEGTGFENLRPTLPKPDTSVPSPPPSSTTETIGTPPAVPVAEPAPQPPAPPGPPRPRRTGLVVGVIVAVVVVAAGVIAFVLTRGDEPDVQGGPQGAEQATPDQAAPAQGPAIETPAGTLFVEETEFSDTWPPGCDASGVDPTCSQAQLGYQVLVVWLTSESADNQATSDAILDVYGDVYVLDSAGERTKGFAGGLLSGRLLIAFTPPDTSTGFTMYWPGNDPVELGL